MQNTTSFSDDGSDADTLERIGYTALRNQQFERSCSAYAAYLQLRPNDLVGHLTYAEALFQRGMREENPERRQSLELSEKHLLLSGAGQRFPQRTYYLLGVVNLNNEKAEAAKEYLYRALRYEAHQDDIYRCLGAAYFQRGDMESAKRSYKRSLSVTKDASAFHGLGCAHAQLGKIAAAKAAYEEAITRNIDLPCETWINEIDQIRTTPLMAARTSLQRTYLRRRNKENTFESLQRRLATAKSMARLRLKAWLANR